MAAIANLPNCEHDEPLFAAMHHKRHYGPAMEPPGLPGDNAAAFFPQPKGHAMKVLAIAGSLRRDAIDWLSRPLAKNALVGKLVAVIGATRGRWGTRLAQAALRQTLFSTESPILSRPVLYLAQADSAFDELGNLTDERVRTTLGEILVAMRQAVPATRSP
jgi:hypothetical protein